MRHIDYEVFVQMMNRWTDEDQARLAQAKARHTIESCAFVNAVREESPSIDRAATTHAAEDAGIHPDLLTIASAWRRDLHWTDVGRYATKGPRGSATQRLRVSGDANGARCGEAYVVVDEVSGEIEERSRS